MRLAEVPHLAVSGGAYAFTLPSVFVDQIAGNEDEGWGVALRPAGYVAADYFFRDRGAGVSLGVAVVLARLVISNAASPGSTAYAALYAVPRVAYTTFVWRGLYLAPSLGVEFHAKVAGSTRLGSDSFEPVGVQPTLGLQLGYVFQRPR